MILQQINIVCIAFAHMYCHHTFVLPLSALFVRNAFDAGIRNSPYAMHLTQAYAMVPAQCGWSKNT